MPKSCVISIWCGVEIVEAVKNTSQCTNSSFPTTYLGLPISDRKLRRGDLLTWIEKIANKLLGWKASLLTLAGQTVLVRFVLTAIPIHLLVAIKVSKWFLRAVDKIRREFFVAGQKRGQCR